MSTVMSDSTLSRYLPKGAVSQEIMELPRENNGGVEWNTLGNILVAHALGEVVCASYVDRLYGRARPGFEPDTDWRFFYKEKNVVVLKKQLPGSPINCYMGRTVVDLPPREVFEFLAINESAHHFDRYVVESKCVKYLRDEAHKKDGISYMRHEGKHCLMKAKRDFLFYVRWEVLSDGKCVMSTLSIDHPVCPPIPGITRGQLRPGTGWVLEAYKGDPTRTLVSYLVHVDLVNLPPLLTNRVMRRQPLSVHYLKEYLLQHRQPPPRPSVLPTLSSGNRAPRSIVETDGLADPPTTPDIPTPATSRQVHCNFSPSLPMESNPLYQSLMFRSNGSSKVSINSNKVSQQVSERSHENADCGLLNIGALVKKQVSVVPEGSEEDVSTRLLEVEADLNSSHGFPFELTNSSKPTSEERAKDTRRAMNSQDQWLLVPHQLSSPYCNDNSPYSHSPTQIKCIKRPVTPDVPPGHSQGTE